VIAEPRERRIVAAIIAGGQATRMGGVLKSHLVIAGHTILDRQLAVLRPTFSRVVVVANEAAPFAGLEVIGDPPPAGRGPLAAFAAALANLRPDEDAVVCVAGDMPYLDAKVLALLRDIAPDAPAVVPQAQGRLQTLCARYGRACLPHLRARLASGDLRAWAFAESVGATIVDEATLRALDPQLLTFDNINTAEDLSRSAARAVKP
jgi:molybdopterin-guanine dinucleotide biosynthesis protein A